MVNLNGALGALLRSWWLVLTISGISALLAYHSVRQTPATYVATSTLMVGDVLRSPKPGEGEFSVAQNLANGYAQIALRQPVLEGSTRALNLPFGWEELRRRIVIVHPAGALTIEIRAMDSDPIRARDIAATIGDQMVAASPTTSRRGEMDQRRKFVQDEMNDLQRQIQSARDDLDKKRADLSKETNARAVLDRQDEIKAAEQKLDSWRASYTSLAASLDARGDPNSLTVIEPAAIPSSPTSPRGLWYVLLAGVGGSIIAATGIVGMELFNDRIRSLFDLRGALREKADGLLAYIPRMDAKLGPLAVLSDPDSLAADSFRLLAAQLRFGILGAGPHLLMVTSATNGEGKSTTAANLASAFALGGTRVLLVDLDLRKPTIHTLFGLANRGGAAAMFRDRDFAIERYAMKTALPYLRIIPAGTAMGNPAELISRSAEPLLLAAWSNADIVIVDGPPLLAVPDSVILTGFIPDTLCVTRFEKTSGRDLRAAMNILDGLPTQLRGVIFNAVPNEVTHLTGYQYAEPAAGLSAWKPFGRRVRQAALPAAASTLAPREPELQDF